MKKLLTLVITILVLTLFGIIPGFEQAYGASRDTPIKAEELNTTEQVGPPWFDAGWHYRRPVIIHSISALPWYQVLITLNDGNFDFSRLRIDGADLHFTHSDGTTLLEYWIESWDYADHQAYIWVRVPSLAAGDTTIYLYYNNPNATTRSSGETTFDGFDDDWIQFSGMALNQALKAQKSDSPQSVEFPFAWATISGSPTISSGILNLSDSTGIKSNSYYQYQAVGFRANFGTGSGHEWAGFINGANKPWTIIGDLPTDLDGLYLINNVNTVNSTILEGASDWHNAFHIYELRWRPGWTEGNIDHGVSSASSTAQVPSTSLPVTFYSYQGSNATLQVDWVYVRQYHDPEPTFDISPEQGLVELGVTSVDSPDPLRKDTSLTYQLTISNSGSIDAPGVVVTDTLPANVLIGPINPSQGSCTPGSIVVCDLDTVLANTIARVTIILTPTMDGLITNAAIVGSPGYELNMGDNFSEQQTLVDTIPPTVNWEKPVQTGGTYITSGGQVTLEASATDEADQVAWVQFKYWDHINLSYVTIGTDYTYPYQVPFDSNVLVSNQTYQMFALASDRAGNLTNYRDPEHPMRIYMIRRSQVYLPMISKK